MAFSLKAGEHFHAIFSSGVTLEARLVYRVATELSKVRLGRWGQVNLDRRGLPQFLRICRKLLSIFLRLQKQHDLKLVLGKLALEVSFLFLVIRARLLFAD